MEETNKYIYVFEHSSQLKQVSRVECAGVLDLKYINEMDLVVACLVSSEVVFYKDGLKLIKTIDLNTHSANERAETIKNLYISHNVSGN
jgi:hypothetical protein